MRAPALSEEEEAVLADIVAHPGTTVVSLMLRFYDRESWIRGEVARRTGCRGPEFPTLLPGVLGAFGTVFYARYLDALADRGLIEGRTDPYIEHVHAFPLAHTEASRIAAVQSIRWHPGLTG